MVKSHPDIIPHGGIYVSRLSVDWYGMDALFVDYQIRVLSCLSVRDAGRQDLVVAGRQIVCTVA